MAPDLFRVDVSKRALAFVVALSGERQQMLVEILLSLGAVPVGPQLYAIDYQVTPDAIKSALKDMEKGECIYLLSPDGDRIGLSLLLPPSIEEGISVREV